jgi:hypothetical protein
VSWLSKTIILFESTKPGEAETCVRKFIESSLLLSVCSDNLNLMDRKQVPPSMKFTKNGRQTCIKSFLTQTMILLPTGEAKERGEASTVYANWESPFDSLITRYGGSGHRILRPWSSDYILLIKTSVRKLWEKMSLMRWLTISWLATVCLESLFSTCSFSGSGY